MNSIQEFPARLLQSFGGGDVGGDHELLDQFVGIQALPVGDGFDTAVLGQPDDPFRHLQFEDAARFAILEQCLICPIKRLDHGLQQWLGDLIGMAVLGRLNLLIGQSRF